MPNRYEREIEEILRNMDHPETKAGSGQKIGERFNRPAPTRMRSRQPRTVITLSSSERLLLLAVGAAILAGGYAYLVNKDIISLTLAIVSIICLTLLIITQFRSTPRRNPRTFRYQTITITPIRRDPISYLRTRWNLFKLKMRYRRKDEQ